VREPAAEVDLPSPPLRDRRVRLSGPLREPVLLRHAHPIPPSAAPSVAPAQAEVHNVARAWIPACAGMTNGVLGSTRDLTSRHPRPIATRLLLHSRAPSAARPIRSLPPLSVTPAQAGVHEVAGAWIPACAGMTAGDGARIMDCGFRGNDRGVSRPPSALSGWLNSPIGLDRPSVARKGQNVRPMPRRSALQPDV